MQSFPLCRLPLLAISEVIKSMNTEEIFLFSLVSKKSQNFVMLSLPKNSFSAEFTFKEHGLVFELIPKDFTNQVFEILPETTYKTEREPVSTIFSTCGLYVQCEFSSYSETSEVEESTRKLCHRFSKTFKSSIFDLKFEYDTREDFAMELIKFAWENDFLLDRIDFLLEHASSESIQLLLNECNEHHTSLAIESKVQEGFKYTPPPGGYKFKSLTVEYAHWVNMDDFLQCRNVVFLEGFPDLTVEYLNGLLKKIVNVESRMESFNLKLKSIEPSEFAEIVRGLSGSAIIQKEKWQGLQFERKDGLKLLITLIGGYLQVEEDYL